MSKRFSKILFLTVLLLSAVLFTAPQKADATTGVPYLINFQGKVTNSNGTNVANTSYSFVFKIYNVSSGGAALWTETQTLSTTDGIFQANLDSVAANNFSGVDFNTFPLYLGITFNGDPEMSPRIQLTSAPYALNSDKLQGIAASGFVQLGPSAAQADASTNSSIFINKTGASGNILQLQNNNGGSPINVLTLSNTGALTLQNQTDSGAALLIKNLAGNNLFDVSTSGNTVTVGSAAQPVTASNGLRIFATSGTTAALEVDTPGGNATDSAFFGANASRAMFGYDGTNSNAAITSGAGKGFSLSVNAAALASPQFSLNTNGAATFKNSTDSSIALQLQNAFGDGLLSADTTNTTNLITNPSFEVSPISTNWVAEGSPAPTQDTANQYIGNDSGQVSATAAKDGFKQTLSSTLAATTTYTLSFYAKQISGTAFSTLAATYDFNSTVGNEAACSGFSSTSVGTAGWNRYSCQFTTGSAGTAPTSSNYIGIYQTDASTRVWDIDAVQLEVASASSAFPTAYREGNLQLNATITSPVTFKNLQDSTTAFQIQNSANGTTYFNADSTLGVISQKPFGQTYLGGVDSSGTTNSGGGSTTLNDAVSSGRYIFVTKNGSVNACTTATGCELQIYDATIPGSPTYIGGADATGSANSNTGNLAFSSVATSGHFAFVTTVGSATACSQAVGSAIGCELQIYDISNPASPAYVGGADSSGSTNSGTGADGFNWVAVSGRYAYVGKAANATACSSTPGSAIGCEIQIYDISNPANPTLLSGTDASGTVNSGVGSVVIDSLTVSGRYLYVAKGGNAGACTSAIGCEFQIYDVSNPASPAYAGGADSTGATNANTGSSAFNSISIAGRYAYVAKGSNATACTGVSPTSIGCELQVYDISKPTTPTIIGGADASGSTNSGTANSAMTSIFVSGRYAYVALAASATACSQVPGSAIGCEQQTYDVSTPSVPTYVGGADSGGLTNAGTGSVASNTVFVSGRYAYYTRNGNSTACVQAPGSAQGCELQTYDISGIEATSVTAHSLEAGTLSVDQGATIANQLSVGGAVNIGQSLDVQGDLGVGGKVLFQNQTNSANAFQIQNQAGSQLLNLDTTAVNSNVITDPSFEAGISNWPLVAGTPTLSSDATTSYIGKQSLKIQTDATANEGAKFVVGAVANNTYEFSVYAKASGSNFSTLEIGNSNDGSTLVPCLSTQTVVTGGWTRFSCSFNFTSAAAGAFVYVRDTGTSHTFNVDGTSLVQTVTTTATPYQDAAVILNSVVNSPSVYRNSSDSTTAFQIQNSAGTSNLLVADTLDGRVGIGTAAPAQTLDVNGVIRAQQFRATSDGLVNDASFNNAEVKVLAAGTVIDRNIADANAALQVKQLNASSTGHILDLFNSGGAVAFFDVNGNFSTNGTVNSVTGYKFNGTAGSTVTCSSGNYLNSQVVQGGIITGGSCSAVGGGGATLQSAYTADSAGNDIVLDTTRNGIQIQDASGTPVTGDLFDLQSNGAGTTYFGVSSSTVQLTDGLTQSGGAVSLTGNASSSFSTSTGDLTLDATSGSTPNINIGTGTQAKNITIGTTSAQGIGTTTQTINIGNLNTTGTTNVNIGTGGTATAGQTALTSKNALVLGGGISSSILARTNSGGAIDIGDNTVANTVQIGTTSALGSGGTTQAINIGNLNTTGTQNITIGTGGSATAGTTLLQGRTSTTVDSSGSVGVGNTNATSVTIGNTSGSSLVTILGAASGGINIGQGGVNVPIQIGAESAAVTQTIDLGFNNTAATNDTVRIGSSIGSSTTLLQGGTGLSAVGIQSGASGTISVGTTAQAGTIQIGTTSTNTGNIQAIGLGNLNAAGTTNVTIGTGTSATGGTTTIQGKSGINLNSPVGVTIQGSNSTTAFQIQNGSSAPIASIDTTYTGGNVVTDPSFESGISNWPTLGTGAPALTNDATTSYVGNKNLKIATDATANEGVKFVVGAVANNTYMFSVYVKLNSGTMTTFQMGNSNDGSTLIPCTLSPSNSPIIGGYTRFYCNVTFTSAASSAFVYLRDTGTSHTFFVDATDLAISSATYPTPYGDSFINLNGVIGSPVSFRNNSDSTTAFQIQSASGGSNLLTVDTLDGQVGIGGIPVAGKGLLTIGTNTTGIASNAGVYFGTDTPLYRSGTTELSLGGQLRVQGPSAVVNGQDVLKVTSSSSAAVGFSVVAKGNNNVALVLKATGNGDEVFQIDGDAGAISWADPSTGTLDTNLYRISSGLLHTDNAFESGTTINATSGYKFNNTAGSTVTCGSGNYLNSQVVQGGITTAGSCAAVSGATSLQNAYTNSSSSPPEILLDTTRNGIQIQDAASTGVTGDLFDVQNNGATITYLGVAAGTTTVNGKASGSADAFDVSNNSSTGAIAVFKDNSTPVLTVGDGGLLTLLPAASLTSGQTHIAESFTNASTTGGTVQGLQQTVTVNNTTTLSNTTANAITVTDSTAGSLANVNTGLAITLQGTNASQQQVGISVTANNGEGLNVITTGFATGQNLCGFSGEPITVCGDAQSTSANHGIGITGRVAASGNTITSNAGSGIIGTVNSTALQTAGAFYRGVKGDSELTSNTNAYTSIGVQGVASAGTAATVYAGYFQTTSASTNTGGAVIYGSDGTSGTLQLLQLQNNTTDKFTVSSGGNVVAAGTYNTNTFNGTTLTFGGASGLVSSSSGGLTLQAASGTVSLGSSTALTASGALTVDSASGTTLQIGTGANAHNVTVGNATTTSSLTLNAGSGNIIIGASTLQRVAVGTTSIDLKDSSATTLALTNSGTSGIASFTATGDIAAGTGRVFKVGATSGLTQNCTTGNYLNTINVLGGIVTSGTCTAAGGGSGTLQNAYDNSTTPATILLADAKNFVINAADTTTDPSIVFNLQCVTSCGSNGQFQIQNAGTNVFTVAPNGGNVTIQSKTNSATAFQIINQNNTATPFVVDTGNNRVGVNLGTGVAPTEALDVNGTIRARGSIEQGLGTQLNWNDVCDPSGSCSDTYRQTGQAFAFFQSTVRSQFEFYAAPSGTAGTSIGFANPVETVSGTGQIALRNTSNSSTAFQIQNTAGDSEAAVDTTTVNLLANPSIEQALSSSNWQAKGTPSTFALDATQQYVGTNSLKITTSAATNDGTKQNITLGAGTYSLSFEAKMDSASESLSVLAAGYASDGSTDTDCALNTTTASAAGWTRFTCTFAVVSTSGTPYLYVKQENNVAHTVYLDALQLETGSTATAFTDGRIALNGVINSPATFRNQTDSMNGFQVQNSSSTPLFVADTLDAQLNVVRTVTSGNLLTSTSASQISTSTTNTTASSDTFGAVQTGIITNADGLPFMVARDSTKGGLFAVKCTNEACTSSTSTPVETSSNTGYFPAVALGRDGLPMIAEGGSGIGLVTEHCLNLSCSSSSEHTIDSLPLTGNSYMTSIAIGSDGFPIISYRDDNLLDAKVAHCTSVDCSGTVNVSTIDGDGLSGHSSNSEGVFTSIAIGPDGLADISYKDNTSADARYVHCTNVSCTTQGTIITLPDSASSVGSETSLVIGSDGLPLISYDNVTGTTMDVAHCTAITCSGTVNLATVDTVSTGSTSALVGQDGLPLIFYRDATNTRLKAVHCGNVTCSSGNTITVVDSSNTNVGDQVQGTILPDGLPIASELDSTATVHLLVTRCGSTTCSGSATTQTGGLSLGASGDQLQNAYIQAIKTSDAVNPFTISTNNITRLSIDGSGNATFSTNTIFKPTTNSTTAFQIQNASGNSIFRVDTTDTNLIANPGFESTVSTNWVAERSGGVAPTQDATNEYLGLASGQMSGTTAKDGFQQTLGTTLTASTTYTLSFYAKQISGAAFTTLAATYDFNSTVGNEAACSNFSSTTVSTAGWARYSCQFTTGSAGTAPTSTNYIGIYQTDTATRVWDIDAVQLETGTLASAYGAGTISLNSNITSPVNFKNIQDSTSAFQITDANDNNILNVDTTNANQNNLVTNASFETGTTGWAGKNTATIAQTSVFTTGGGSILPQNGKQVLKVTTNTTATSDGAKFPLTMVNGTAYTLTLYVKTDVGQVSTFEIGRADNGSTDTSCLTAQKASNLGWTKLNCSFIAGAQSGAPYVYVRQTDNTTTARTFYVDAVLMQTDATAETSYRDGKVSFQGSLINSAIQIQTDSNTSNAFQIQNAAGVQVFNISTTNQNLISNPGFEVNTTGWSVNAGATVLQRDATNSYAGVASGKFTTAVTANSGVRYTFPSQLPSAAYVLSFYAQTNSADAGLTAGFNNGADTTCTGLTPAPSATVPSTTGWTRFSCTIPTNVVNSIFISSGSQIISTFNLDGVQLELGSTATNYGQGVVSLNASVNSAASFEAGSNSTTAFQIQNSSGVNMFAIDTLNTAVNINTVATGGTVSVGTAFTTGSVTIGSTAQTSGVTTINGGTGTGALGTATSGIALVPGVAGTINIGNSAGTGQITIGSSSTAQTVAIGAGAGVATVQIAGGSAANVVQIANGQAGGSVSIGAAQTTGTIAIGGLQTSGTLSLGAGSAVRTGDLVIGSTGTTSGRLRLFGGTGTGAFGGSTSGIDIAPGVAGTVNIGATGGAGTGAITVGQSTASYALNLGLGVTAAGNTKSIHIGDTQNASTGVTAITIGLNNTSTGVNTVTIKAGGSGASRGPDMTLGPGTTASGICSSLAVGVAPTAGTAVAINDCAANPTADYAEEYPVASDVAIGDLVALGTKSVTAYDVSPSDTTDWSKVLGQIRELVKSQQPYQDNVIGVVSDNKSDFSSTGYNIKQADNPMSVALNGRVPVKIAADSDPIQPGDYLTASSTSGRATKATHAGEVIGKALDSWTADSGKAQIMVFVQQGYWPGPGAASMIQNGGDANLANLAVNGNTTLADLSVTGTADFANINLSGVFKAHDLQVTGTATIQNLTVVDSLTANTVTIATSLSVPTLQVGDSIQLGSKTEDPTVPTAHPITKSFKASKAIQVGDVVVLNVSAGNGWVTTTTQSGSKLVVGVAYTAAASQGDTIQVAISGTAKVNLTGPAAIGDLVHTDSVEGTVSTVANPSSGELVGKVITTPDSSHQIIILIALQ